MLIYRYCGAEPQCNASIIVALKSVIAGAVREKGTKISSVQRSWGRNFRAVAEGLVR